MVKAVVFCPQNPIPPASGSHRRIMSVLAALRDIGVSTTLTSSQLTAGNGWTDDSVRMLRDQYVSAVHVHSADAFDRLFVDRGERLCRRLKRPRPAISILNTPPGMRRWFRRILAVADPRVLFMNYALFDGLVPHWRMRKVRRILESHDLVTLNKQMWRCLSTALPVLPVDVGFVPSGVTDLDFFERLYLQPEHQEFRIYDRYDYTMTISPRETATVRAATRHTSVVYVPVTQEVVDVENTYDGPAIFASGPNPFNVQGLLFFAKHVLPRVMTEQSDFLLQVTGYCSTTLQPIRGIDPAGFVPDITTAYAHARFAVCPVFGLTGQQVKIVEAMAAGLPVIALTAAAQSSPIQHGINGLVANDAVDFADHVLTLWRDRDLCRQLGANARATIQRDFSAKRLRHALAQMIEVPAVCP